jgi:hypothetical protein
MVLSTLIIQKSTAALNIGAGVKTMPALSCLAVSGPRSGLPPVAISGRIWRKAGRCRHCWSDAARATHRIGDVSCRDKGDGEAVEYLVEGRHAEAGVVRTAQQHLLDRPVLDRHLRVLGGAEARIIVDPEGAGDVEIVEDREQDFGIGRLMLRLFGVSALTLSNAARKITGAVAAAASEPLNS